MREHLAFKGNLRRPRLRRAPSPVPLLERNSQRRQPRWTRILWSSGVFFLGYISGTLASTSDGRLNALGRAHLAEQALERALHEVDRLENSLVVEQITLVEMQGHYRKLRDTHTIVQFVERFPWLCEENGRRHLIPWAKVPDNPLVARR